MIGQENGGMTIAQWNASKVPKYQHETPFFIVHVPAGPISAI